MHGATEASGRTVPLLWSGAAALAATILGVALAAAGTTGAVLALGGLAAVGALVLAAHQPPAHLLSAGCALAMLSGNWSLLGLPFGVDRLVVLGGVMATLMAAARDPDVRLVTRPVHLGLMAATAWTWASAVMAGTAGDTVAIYALLDRYGVVPFLAFATAPYAFRTLPQRLALVKTLVLMGLYLGATAVFEEIGPRALVFPRFILDPSVGLHADRARGPFLEAAANGVVLVMCGVVAAYGLAHLAPRWRWACRLAVVLTVVGAGLTLTRSVWIALVVSGVAAMLYAPGLRRYLLPSLAGLVLVVVAFLTLVPAVSTTAQERAGDTSPVWDRKNLVTASLNVLDAHPLTGLGWSRFAKDSPDYYRQAETYPQQGEGLVVHNVPLLYATETGLVGLALWLAAAGVALVGPLTRRLGRAMDAWQAAHLAILLAWAIVSMFAPMAQLLPTLLVFLWAGVTAGAVPWMSPLAARPASAGDAGAPRGTPDGAEPATPAPT